MGITEEVVINGLRLVPHGCNILIEFITGAGRKSGFTANEPIKQVSLPFRSTSRPDWFVKVNGREVLLQ